MKCCSTISARLAERGTDGSRGFEPTVEDVRLGGVAERRMNVGRGGRSGVATRRGCGSAPYRGLKPTATLTPSLRDEHFPSPEGARDDSPGQRPEFGVAESREPCQGDTTDDSSLFRPFRAGSVSGINYLVPRPVLLCDGISDLGERPIPFFK